MTAFDLSRSMERARRRLGGPAAKGPRRPRSDRGQPRTDPRVVELLAGLVGGHAPPSMTEVLRRLGEDCRGRGLAPPSRATVYKLLRKLPTPALRWDDLPPSARAALYNLGPGSRVPAHQVVFCCFNYGDLSAASFAAGLPWLALYQALRLPGHRPRCRALLEAAARARGLR
jgi:hypothetical protein